jgi:hypothetical protein
MFDNDVRAGVSRWPVVRVQAGGVTSVTVCSDRFLPLTTHWVGHTAVCPGEGCSLCDVLAARGLFYLACVCGGRPSILELGAHSASHFEQHCRLLHGGVRPGLVVELRRRSKKSPVHSEVVDTMDNAVAVPLREFVAKVMTLYHFPGPNPGETFPCYEERLRSMVLSRSERERRLFESRVPRRV